MWRTVSITVRLAIIVNKKEVDANVNLGDELEGLSDEQLQAIIDGKEEK